MKKNSILDYYARRGLAFLHGGGKNATDQLIHCMQLRGNEKILEIGYGTGATLIRLHHLYPDLLLYGIECSATMHRQAIKRHRFVGLPVNNLHLASPDQFPYPFESCFFDLIYLESVLSILSVEEIKKILSEILRLLKPNGLFVLNESIWLDALSNQEKQELALKSIQLLGIPMAHQTLFTVQDWHHLFRNSGFEVIKTQPVNPSLKMYKHTIKDRISNIFNLYQRFIHVFESDQKKWENAILILNKYIKPGISRMEATIFVMRTMT